MKAIRLPLAIFMALSLFLSPAASLAQAPTKEIIQNPSPTANQLAAVNWCFASALNGWNNSSTPMYDDGNNGDPIAGDGIYTYVTSIPTPGTYAWKAVECGNWDISHPAADSWVTTGSPLQYVIFTLDTNDYSLNAGMALLPASNIVNVKGDNLPTSYTAVGDFNGWNNSDSATLMEDMGKGFYRLIYPIPTAGVHFGRAVITGTWNGFGADGRSSNAANINFTTTEADQEVVILLDSFSGRLLIEPASSGTGPWCVASSLDTWATHNPLYDDGTNGDLLGGDGVFTTDIIIPTAGRYEFKVTNGTWTESYPADNSWLNTTEDNQIVKLTFDTNDHSADAGLQMVPAVNIVHAWDTTNSFTAVGDFQGWNNADPNTSLGMDGRGLYILNYPIATAGAQNFKIVSTGTWDAIGLDNRSISASNIPFVTYADEDVVWFYLDYRTGRVGVFPTPSSGPLEPGHDNEVWWDYLAHDSRDAIYRTPGGPVTTDTEVILRLRAAQGDLTEAKLRLYNDRTNVQSLLPMSVAHSDGTYDWWEATVPASADPTVYWYRFIAIDGTDTDYYEDDAARTMGLGEAFDETQDYSYQLTVYAPDFQTPDWIKNAIVYQVFPDRFRDGDPSNNKPAGTFFYGEEGGTVYRSLTDDWNTYICDPRGTDDCAGTYSKNFYGGDLAGLTDELDYLESLGVNTIYLNPIFESPSNHGYDTTDYLSINEMFGTQADYDALIAELDSRSMHLIVDGVFNHVSSDSKYLDRYERYDEVGACESPTSLYREWFYFTDVPAGTGPCVGSDGTPGGANYESWWGYDTLPKLNSSNPEVRAWIWDNQDNPETTVAGHWMLTADGWRLDVGGDVDPGTLNDTTNDYWEGFRDTVHAVNSEEGYITGEEWGIANSWLLGGEWDAVMNYQFSSAVLSLWRDSTFTDNDHNTGSSAGALAPLSMEQFDERILNLQERYAPEALYAMLNLFGSHDTNRALFMLDENTNTMEPADYLDPNYNWTPAIEKLKGAALVQMTMPGAPTIYYGDEVGLVGPVAKDGSGVWQDDPYNRQPYPWLDQSGTPFYSHLQSPTAQAELYDYYANLTAARNDHVALRLGDYRTLLVDDENALYAYGRHVPEYGAAIVVINRDSSQQLVSLNVDGYLPYLTDLSDVMSTNTYTISAAGMVENIVVPANSGAVLVSTGFISAAPEPVIDLAVTYTGADTVALAWSAAVSANAYEVYRSYLSGGGYELVGETSNTTFTDTGLTPGQRVYYIVFAKSTIVGLLSGPSNEVSALPAYTIGWANLQSPSSITHTIGLLPTPEIYGWVWIAGVTLLPGPTPTLIAQVGYGPDGSLPLDNPEWVWYDTEFNGQTEDNDEEFKGTLLPEAVGDYDYAYRYSTTAGESWVYADLDGTENGYSIEQAGSLTVTPSTDTTPPSAPVLSVEDWSASSISLSWTESTDDVAVYAYDIYRDTGGFHFEKIGRTLAPVTTYTDMSVENLEMYYYFVVALDTSFNRSENSNIVEHMAEPKIVQVTFEVTVPEWTPGTVYIVGGHPTVGDWNPGAVPMTMISDTLWGYTANILDGTSFEFKITRGNWETVMKGADGNEELANLPITVEYGADGTQTYAYTVLNWRDPIVLDTSPVNGATEVALDAAIVVTWSQAMAASACPTVWIEPNPADLIPVTCSFNAATNEMTITPTDVLPSSATIGVGLSGLGDAGGDTQQVSYPLFFTTIFVDPLPIKSYLPLIFR